MRPARRPHRQTPSPEQTHRRACATSLAVQAVIDRLRAEGTIPPSAEVRLGGVTAHQSEAFGGLFAAMGIAILPPLLLFLVLQRSFIQGLAAAAVRR